MATNRTVTTTVQYQVNQSSVAAVQAANNVVAGSFSAAQAKAAASFAQLSALSAQTFAAAGVAVNTNLVAPMQAASAATQNVIRDIRSLADISKQEIAKLPDPSGSAFGLPDDFGVSGGGGAGSALGKARMAAIALPGVGFQSPIVLGLRAAELAADKTGASLSQVGLSFGIVGVALIAVKVAADAFAHSVEAGKTNLDGALQAQNNYYHAVTKLTTEQVNEDIEQRRKANQALQIQINETQAALDAVRNRGGALGQLGGAIAEGLGVSPANQLKTQLDDLNKQFTANDLTAVRLTQGLAANAFAANDAAAAEEKLAEARKAADDRITQTELDRAHAAADAMKMTAAERQKEADSIEAEITALEEFQATLDSGSPAAKQLNVEITDLENRLTEITGVTHSWADTLADIDQRAESVNNLFDALTKEGEAEQKVAEARQAVADAATDHADKLRSIDADEADKEAADRAKAAQQAEDDQAKHLQKLADIDKQYATDHEAAVGNRDALANYQAAQKRDDATTKENEAYALQEQQLQAHLDDQLAQDRAAQQKQIAEENASYNKRNAQLIRALNDAQVEESRAAGRALAYQRQANDAQLNERIRANNNVAAVQQNANSALVSNTIQTQSAILSAVYYGSSSVQTAFINLMGSLTQIVQSTTLTPYIGIGNPGGHSLIGGAGSPDSYIRGIVDNQVARMMRDANR